jgi:hypothetical protein
MIRSQQPQLTCAVRIEAYLKQFIPARVGGQARLAINL